MTLLETLALLTFILTLLGPIVDVIRLTVEVMAKTSQKKDDDNKKIDRQRFPATRSILIAG
ncbi:MAG: hypothetical protein ACLTHC_03185 [Faecalibacterium sp.]